MLPKPPSAEWRPRLVVVGHGMVSHRFCNALCGSAESALFRVVIFGDESVPAYDRVHLGTVIEDRNSDPSLATCASYQERGLELVVGDPVVTIDRADRVVHTRSGRREPYDVLVLATGSRTRMPSAFGVESHGALPYRTLADAQRIADLCTPESRVAVLGGGLLGLECAHALARRGSRVDVLEAKDSLLPNQLDAASGAVLAQHLAERGVRAHTGYRLMRIDNGERGLVLHGQGASPLRVDHLVVAIGVVPEDSLARACDLKCAPLGGIVVDESLSTSDPRIYAIGDCASYEGVAYGFVAPGYAMADALAARLRGDLTSTFVGADRSCRLKIADIEIAALGEYNEDGLKIAFTGEGVRRTLTLDRDTGRMLGATIVGAWEQTAEVQSAIAEKAALSKRAIRRFVETGEVDIGRKSLPVAQWDEAKIVCHCTRVCRGRLSDAIIDGATSLHDLGSATGAGTVCGSCTPLLAELAGRPSVPLRSRWSGWTGVASAFAVLAFFTVLLVPPPATARSVVQAGHALDALWRSSLWKQASGYSVVGAFVLSLLLSARKRLRWFRWGDYGLYRALHTSLGVIALIGLMAHTGMRFGAHLNFALMSVFLAASLLGSLAGIAAYLETKGKKSMALLLRGTLANMHLFVLWPLPVLLIFHVLSVYYF